MRRRRPVKVEREPQTPKVATPRTLDGVPRSTILAAMSDAPALPDALTELGTSSSHLRKLIENDGELYALFVKLSGRARSERERAS
jgi:hypothetical protein